MRKPQSEYSTKMLEDLEVLQAYTMELAQLALEKGKEGGPTYAEEPDPIGDVAVAVNAMHLAVTTLQLITCIRYSLPA